MRTGWGWGAALALALAASPPLARAHDLKCDKTVNGQKILEVMQYPEGGVQLDYEWKVVNLHPTAVSYLLWEKDSLLFPTPRLPDGAGPEGLPIGDDTPYVGHASLTITSWAQCAELAGITPVPGQIITLDNRYAAGFEMGEAQCTARVLCFPPEVPPGATRTMGFFKTHIAAAEQCLAGGAIDLGFTSIGTVNEFMGLLWASPSAYQDLDKARFLAARQLETAICNTRLFGTDAGTLISDAQAALAGTNCTAILDLAAQLDAFNNSGDAIAFPDGFVPGPATPVEAAALATPITFPGGTCE